MSALAPRQNGYMNATRSVGTTRDVEYQLFARITGRLNQATLGKADFKELVSAIDENLTLWRTIAFDVMDEENALPAMLRAQIFYLYEFTRSHSQKVLRKEADALALIDINTSMMRGLRAAAGTEAEEATQCPA